MTKIQFDSEKEIRETLLGYGVQYFRHKAGFIPRNAPEGECGLVDCDWYAKTKWLVNFHGRVHDVYYEPHIEDDIIGEIDYLCGHAAICYECAFKIEREIDNDMIDIYCWIADDYCQLCGKYEDGIPF